MDKKILWEQMVSTASQMYARGFIYCRPGWKPISARARSELPMHLDVYRQRSDVIAAIHAHSITCIALSLVGISMEEPYVPEALVMFGPVPTVSFVTPSSEAIRVHSLG